MPKTCKNRPDAFCYICGKYTPSKQKRTITSSVKRLYRAYFDIQLGDQDNPWAPHIACVNCISGFSHWSKGKRKSMPFGIPMVWREPKNHHHDCYFCMIKPLGRNAKSMKHIKYPNIPSAMQPVPHSDDVPVPICSENVHRRSSSSDSEHAGVDEDFSPTGIHAGSPQLFEQIELDDLVRDLALSKESAQLLGSRLAEKNLLGSSTHFAWYRHRE